MLVSDGVGYGFSGYCGRVVLVPDLVTLMLVSFIHKYLKFFENKGTYFLFTDHRTASEVKMPKLKKL